MGFEDKVEVLDHSIKNIINLKKENRGSLRCHEKNNLWIIAIEEREEYQASGVDWIFNKITEENVPQVQERQT